MTVTIEQAQARLGELIDKLAPDEELILTRNSQPVAKISKTPSAVRQPREPGSAKDKILWISPDFDEPLEEFREYME